MFIYQTTKNGIPLQDPGSSHSGCDQEFAEMILVGAGNE
jgi:hypothetical protein